MNRARNIKKFYKRYFKSAYPKESAFLGKLYYDETNNFRKFYLKEDGWNCEALNLFYVLGGLAIEKGQVVDVNTLLTKLQFQKGIKEIKFKNMVLNAKNFPEILSSNRIDAFLSWLLDNNVKTHYQVMNFIFFALSDIVDAAMEQYLAIYDKDMVLLLKSALYEIVKQDIDHFVKVLFTYGYPDVTDTKGFMNEFLPYIEDYLIKVDNESEAFFVAYLLQIIKAAARQDNLAILHNAKSNIIFEDLSSAYLMEGCRFPNAELIFDQEPNVEQRVTAKGSNVLFVDSKDNIFVQLSDVTVGLISKYYNFLEEAEDITKSVNNLTAIQINVLRKLVLQLVKSVQYNQLFDSYIGGQRAIKNHNILMDLLCS